MAIHIYMQFKNLSNNIYNTCSKGVNKACIYTKTGTDQIYSLFLFSGAQTQEISNESGFQVISVIVLGFGMLGVLLYTGNKMVNISVEESVEKAMNKKRTENPDSPAFPDRSFSQITKEAEKRFGSN